MLPKIAQVETNLMFLENCLFSQRI
jgi:hypothetical protein